MENSVFKILWKLVENWLRNPRNSFTTVNVNPTIVAEFTIYWHHYYNHITIRAWFTTTFRLHIRNHINQQCMIYHHIDIIEITSAISEWFTTILISWKSHQPSVNDASPHWYHRNHISHQWIIYHHIDIIEITSAISEWCTTTLIS